MGKRVGYPSVSDPPWDRKKRKKRGEVEKREKKEKGGVSTIVAPYRIQSTGEKKREGGKREGKAKFGKKGANGKISFFANTCIRKREGRMETDPERKKEKAREGSSFVISSRFTLVGMGVRKGGRGRMEVRGKRGCVRIPRRSRRSKEKRKKEKKKWGRRVGHGKKKKRGGGKGKRELLFTDVKNRPYLLGQKQRKKKKKENKKGK